MTLIRCVRRALAVMLLVPSLPAAAQSGALDCEGPAGDPEPGSLQWQLRDAQNMACAEQRHLDKALHPNTALPLGPLIGDGLPVADAYRQPERHDGQRFRFTRAQIPNRDGDPIDIEIYRPCGAGDCPQLPQALQRHEPPYPAVLVVHGGASRKELHWWASQPLAEAGYLVVALDTASPLSGHRPDSEDVLDWLFSTESTPYMEGLSFPYPEGLDRERVGIAGHSAGGVVAGRLGQEDPRLSAVVSWDRAQSSPLPDDLALRVPAMFQFADYNCQAVPICQPEPYSDPPDPIGPGNKGEDFERALADGVDSMQIAIRAALHLDWTPSALAGARYAEAVSLYFTLAWFDRYLRGRDDPAVAADAFARLTAPAFDDSADVYNISQGFWDPLRAALSGDPLHGGNQPYQLAGMPVADRLSFYFDSRCALRRPVDGAAFGGDAMRETGCTGAAQDGDGGGSLAPAWLLALILVGLLARQRHERQLRRGRCAYWG